MSAGARKRVQAPSARRARVQRQRLSSGVADPVTGSLRKLQNQHRKALKLLNSEKASVIATLQDVENSIKDLRATTEAALQLHKQKQESQMLEILRRLEHLENQVAPGGERLSMPLGSVIPLPTAVEHAPDNPFETGVQQVCHDSGGFAAPDPFSLYPISPEPSRNLPVEASWDLMRFDDNELGGSASTASLTTTVSSTPVQGEMQQVPSGVDEIAAAPSLPMECSLPIMHEQGGEGLLGGGTSSTFEAPSPPLGSQASNTAQEAQPLSAIQLQSPFHPPCSQADEEPRRVYSGTSSHLLRRRTAIQRQAHRYEGLVAKEGSLRENGLEVPVIQDALKKAGENLGKCEQLMRVAEEADDELTAFLKSCSVVGEKSEAQRGLEHRALRAKNACESGYSRLCLSMDTAARHVAQAPEIAKAGTLPVQRPGSSPFGSFRSLWSQRAEPPVAVEPVKANRSYSGLGSTAKPSRVASFTSERKPSAGAVLGLSSSKGAQLPKPPARNLDRLSVSSVDSPQASTGAALQTPEHPASGKPGHRRTVSDSTALQHFHAPNHVSGSTKEKGGARQKNAAEELELAQINEDRLDAMLFELEKRRLALYL